MEASEETAIMKLLSVFLDKKLLSVLDMDSLDQLGTVHLSAFSLLHLACCVNNSTSPFL